MSYAALVAHESDFRLARETHLLSEEVLWPTWKTFVKELLDTESIYGHVNKRFFYGKLRLIRLNTIYRLGGGPVRGYQPEFSQYGSFFQANFTWLASLLAYMVVVLAAMQVGLGTRTLQESDAFQAASYGFTVFTIVGSLAAVAVIFAVFLVLLVENWVRTLQYGRTRLSKLEQSGGNAMDA
tara:strand:+ start:20855 stop:21400 length:546 start_codon:yes stop_codon:yes gene_type:complete